MYKIHHITYDIDENNLLDICNRLENQSFETVKSCIYDAIHRANNCPHQYENFIQAIDNLVHGIKPYGKSTCSQDELAMASCYQVGKSFMLYQNNLNKFSSRGCGCVLKKKIIIAAY